MKILGIETSCDETAAAVVEDGIKIISNVVASSQAMHAKYGGIIPEQAAREQVKVIVPVVTEAIESGVGSSEKIDAIAVTVGPGLIGSLLVGVETTKTLSFAWNKPLIPVNHLIGHIYANWLMSPAPILPAMVLLVSGGHTELILMKGHGNFKYLGGTRDDAAGECFDKCARLLGFGYPGGPAIEKAALESGVRSSQFGVKLPRPMINQKNLDFSFSGLKTAVANLVNNNLLTHYPTNLLACELQEAVTDVLVKKTLLAAEKHRVKAILLAGGVAANKRLRKKFQISNFKFQIFYPPVTLCTDNAAYIASAAYFNQHIVPWQKVAADPGLAIDKS